ncbi:hypothetical protein CHS0354_020297 [Potamilus streckersoni]|uniref:MANSC domain-containing protein n=1 Tax=Potamilus streckersoni TaxID=2493646 RepID=A0AAE0S5V0_9BIVA|nr:hypothetical protein CHS0354_020297 [Potamilus streckersoni]
MKTFLQFVLVFAFISGSSSDDVKMQCIPLQFLSNSFLDVTESNSATGQDVTMMDEIMDTSRDQCLEACCDLINDGCTVAVFSEMDAECYLYQCSPVDRCVVSSSANNTTIFIGLASTTSTESGLTNDLSQATTIIPLSQTIEAGKLSTTNQNARTTSTLGKVIQYLTNSTPSSTESPETITTTKQDLAEAVQKTTSTVGQDTTSANQMKESLNNMHKDLSSTPMQQGLDKTTVADDMSLEKSSLPSTTIEHETAPDNPKQTSSTKGPATLATLPKMVTPESQIPPPTRSTLNGQTTESTFSGSSKVTVSKTEGVRTTQATETIESTSVSKTEGDRTTQAAETIESTSVTMNVNGITTEKLSTDNNIKTEANSANKTNIESTTPASRMTSSYVTYTSTPLTTRSTTPGKEHTAAITASSQNIHNSSLTNSTDHVSSTENIQLESGTISITNSTSTISTSTDELIKELHQLNNTVITQSNTSEHIVINKQGSDQIKMNNTLPIIKFSEDMVVSGALIAALSFGILFFFAMMVLVGRRCFEGWKRRHYSRIDYLVNGMYN